MAVELVKGAGPWGLILSGVVDVFDAMALHEAAVESAGSPESVVANLAGVEALDTAATQVLLALKRALAGSDRILGLEGTPPAVVDLWKQAGLGAELDA